MFQDPSEYTQELEKALQVRDLMLAYFREALKLDDERMDMVYHTAEMTIEAMEAIDRAKELEKKLEGSAE